MFDVSSLALKKFRKEISLSLAAFQAGILFQYARFDDRRKNRRVFFAEYKMFCAPRDLCGVYDSECFTVQVKIQIPGHISSMCFYMLNYI